MIKAVITDFSRVLLFPADETYTGGLNSLNSKLQDENPQYNFYSYFKLNDDLLNFYANLNGTVPVYIFTSETIQDHPAVKDKISKLVSGVLSAKKLQVNKSDEGAYIEVLEKLSVKPENVVYVDDNENNTSAASKIGIKTILYKDNTSTIDEINRILELA